MKTTHIYQAPSVFVGLFYVLLGGWTMVCVLLIGTKTLTIGWPLGQLLMIAFVLAYTWYFSLGIAYRLVLEATGDIHLISIRRTINANIKRISLVEGPRLAILPYGFIRFRLEQEKTYLFCLVTDNHLRAALAEISAMNRNIKLKGL